MELTLELSGIPIMLVIEDQNVISEIKEEWSGFLSTKKPLGKLTIITEYTDKKIEEDERTNFYFADNVYVSNNWFSKGAFDFNKNEGKMNAFIGKSTLYGIKVFLFSVWSIYFLQERKLLMHACGVKKDGRGYVFSGKSTTGKTTIAEKSRSYNIFGDDTIVLSLTDNHIEMSSCMLSGQYPANENETTTVDSIHFLEKGNSLERKHITGTDAFFNLTKNTIPFLAFGKKSPDIFIELLKVVPHYLDIIHFYKLVSSKEDDVWKIIN